MNKLSFLFPGQGSQRPGMCRAFYSNFSAARKVIDKAENLLDDCSIKFLCFDADEARLKKTENTQPALYTVGFAIFSVLKEMGVTADLFAGHSLGEYTACAAAGYFSFEDGLKVVRKRGLLMRDCDPEKKGGMAAIIGIDEKAIKKVCEEIGDIYPANFNSNNQVVVSGLKDKIREASDKFKSLGAKRVVELNVSGAFHSPMMMKASKELKRELDAIEWKMGNGLGNGLGKGRIISNATAEISDDVDIIKESLVKQLTSPVLWKNSMIKLFENGYTNFIEAGPGGILRGLFRNIQREAKVFSVEEPEDIDKLDLYDRS